LGQSRRGSPGFRADAPAPSAGYGAIPGGGGNENRMHGKGIHEITQQNCGEVFSCFFPLFQFVQLHCPPAGQHPPPKPSAPKIPSLHTRASLGSQGWPALGCCCCLCIFGRRLRCKIAALRLLWASGGPRWLSARGYRAVTWTGWGDPLYVPGRGPRAGGTGRREESANATFQGAAFVGARGRRGRGPGPRGAGDQVHDTRAGKRLGTEHCGSTECSWNDMVGKLEAEMNRKPRGRLNCGGDGEGGGGRRGPG